MSHVRVAGHFGEFLQGRLGSEGPLALISLPCPALAVQAWHRPGAGLAIHGSGQRLITPGRARGFLSGLGARLSGQVRLRAAMPAGGGAGASTATLVALARLAGDEASPETLARACITSEGASDPLMFAAPKRLLWASRDGRVMQHLPALPRFDVIGGFFGPPHPTDPHDLGFPDIADLVEGWVRAAAAGRAGELAELASLSAGRTLAMRGGADDPTGALGRELGAAGCVIGHTGSARGLLFLPGRIPERARSALQSVGMKGVIRFSLGERS